MDVDSEIWGRRPTVRGLKMFYRREIMKRYENMNRGRGRKSLQSALIGKNVLRQRCAFYRRCWRRELSTAPKNKWTAKASPWIKWILSRGWWLEKNQFFRERRVHILRESGEGSGSSYLQVPCFNFLRFTVEAWFQNGGTAPNFALYIWPI